MPTALDWAYKHTDYVLLPGTCPPIILRVGQSSAALDALMRRWGCVCWAFLTACNPRSRPLPDAANQRRMGQLAERLRQGRWPHCPGYGQAWAGDWPAEASYWVGNMSRAEAGGLGRAFGQNALLWGERGGPAHLLWL